MQHEPTQKPASATIEPHPPPPDKKFTAQPRPTALPQPILVLAPPAVSLPHTDKNEKFPNHASINRQPTAPPQRVRGAATDHRTQHVSYPGHLPDIPPDQRAAFDTAYSWHARLNHTAMGIITCMAKSFAVVNLPTALRNTTSAFPVHCSGCSLAHFQRAPHHGSSPKPPPGYTIVTDIAGPISDGRSTPGKFKHFLTVTELSTNKHLVHLMRSRSEANTKLREAVATVKRHFGQQ